MKTELWRDKMADEMEKIGTSSSEDSNDWVRVVANLIKLTEEGKLKWKSVLPSESLKSEPDSRVDAVYISDFKNKRFKIFAEVIRIDDPAPWVSLPFKKKYPYYVERVVLQIGDKSEHGWYTIPDVDSDTLEDLLESVKYRVLGLEEFLDDFLATEGSKK
jgi:hypothetical protein